MPLCALEHRLGAGVPVFFKQRLFKASGVYAYADGNAALTAGLCYLADIVLAADIARIYAYLVYPALSYGKRETVVKMDIRNQRHIRQALYLRYRLGCRHIGYGKAHDLAAGGAKPLYLFDRCGHIVCLCIAHRLNGDRCKSTYLHRTDFNFLCCLSLKHHFHPVMSLAMSLYIINTIRSSRSTMPPAWI